MGDLLRAVQDLNQGMAYRTAILARRTSPKRKLDETEAGAALGTDDITHSLMMRRFHLPASCQEAMSFFFSNRAHDMLLNCH
jgi:hypothetical protein